MLFVGSYVRLGAQNSRLYTTQQGLTTSDIHHICIDDRGVAWVAELGTVDFFDGTSFHRLATPEKFSFVSANMVGQQDTDRFWLCTSSGLFGYSLSSGSYTHYLLNAAEDSLSGYSVNQMVDLPGSDRAVVTTDGFGIYVFDKAAMEVDTVLSARLQTVVGDGFCVESFMDRNSRLWISTISGGLKVIDPKSMTAIDVVKEGDVTSCFFGNQVTCFAQSLRNGKIYMGTANGLYCFDGRTGAIGLCGSLGCPVSSLLRTADGRILVGTDGRGLWMVDDGTDELTVFETGPVIVNTSFGKVHAMTEDKEGNLLVGLYQKGLLVIPHHQESFRYHAISTLMNGLNAACITSIKVDGSNNYWVATDGCGVFTTDGLHLASARPHNVGIRSLLVQSVVIDRRGTVWIGSFGGGVQCSTADGFTTPEWLNGLRDMRVMALCYDAKSDVIYAGTNGMGVFVVDIEGKRVSRLEIRNTEISWVADVYCDAEGMVWIATVDGVYFCNPRTGVQGEALSSKTLNLTYNCMVMSGGKLLVGSSAGLIVYDTQSHESFTLLDRENIMAISFTEGDVWMSTSSSILSIPVSALSQADEALRPSKYSSLGGFFVGAFHKGSVVKPTADNILFGGDNGIICFTPSMIKKRKQIRNDVVLYLGNELVTGDEVCLSHRQNSLQLGFCVPDFSTPERIHYEYMLEGLDRSWRSCNNMQAQEVFYSSLPSGSYSLRVRAYYESDTPIYRERTVEIRVRYPWYATWWAWLLYIMAACCVAYFIIGAYREKALARREVKEALQQEAIKEAKLRMFTSITHDLRTPLTLILSPLKQLMTSTHDESALSLYGIMQRNCERLLGLVKQITDIRHLDSGTLKLNLKQIDMVRYLNELCKSFTGMATIKGITFVVEHESDMLMMCADPVQFEKVIVNIVSNAFKFTPEGGRIIVRSHLVDTHVEVKIYNSGSHIDSEDLPHVFDRFYQGQGTGQTSAGSGIGLSLVSELVALHGGKVTAENIDPDGVEFVVLVPVGPVGELPEYDESEIASAEDSAVLPEGDDEAETEQEKKVGRRCSVLVVDDDRDMCEYLRSVLGGSYDVTVAMSGNEAWKCVHVSCPDVVVTDFKMPDGDGMELCRRIKQNPETDNIPVIMVTSEEGEEIQLRSLNTNVDYFLSKPFNVLVLKGAIEQVMKVRNIMKGRMNRTEFGYDYNSVKVDDADTKFFGRVNDYIKQHIEEELTVTQLAEDIGISRVHLNRKMKERYGVGTNTYIRSFKLKQAAYILVHQRTNVSEVAYACGFSNLSYFSSSFREYFGMSPREFVATYSENLDDETLKKLLQ